MRAAFFYASQTPIEDPRPYLGHLTTDHPIPHTCAHGKTKTEAAQDP